MGGGGGYRFAYPRNVWGPIGGWWNNPKAWKRNTAVATILSAGILGKLWVWSEERTYTQAMLLELEGREHEYVKERPNRWRGTKLPEFRSVVGNK